MEDALELRVHLESHLNAFLTGTELIAETESHLSLSLEVFDVPVLLTVHELLGMHHLGHLVDTALHTQQHTLPVLFHQDVQVLVPTLAFAQAAGGAGPLLPQETLLAPETLAVAQVPETALETLVAQVLA